VVALVAIGLARPSSINYNLPTLLGVEGESNDQPTQGGDEGNAGRSKIAETSEKSDCGLSLLFFLPHVEESKKPQPQLSFLLLVAQFSTTKC